MALINCVQCGRQVVEGAPICLRCGAPPKPGRRQTWLKVIGACLAVAAVLALLPDEKMQAADEVSPLSEATTRSFTGALIEPPTYAEKTEPDAGAEVAALMARRAAFKVGDAVEGWLGTGCDSKEALIQLRSTYRPGTSPSEGYRLERAHGCVSLQGLFRGTLVEVERAFVDSSPGPNATPDVFPVRVREDGSGRLLWTWAAMLDPATTRARREAARTNGNEMKKSDG